MSKLSRAIDKLNNALKPPPDLSVSDWADTYRVLSREASAEAGLWRTSRAPYFREPMDACKNPRYQRIVVKSASQMGKSELLLNIIGYYSHTDPSPMLLIQPTEAMAEAFSKDRLAPMIRDTKVLSDVFSTAKSRSTNNTILHKPLALDTPIPTPDGFKTMGEIKVGDYVFTPEGTKTRVDYCTPVINGKKCYEIEFSDGEKIKADCDHPWPVKTWKVRKINGKPKQVLVNEILDTETISNNYKKKDRYRYLIDCCKPVCYSEKRLPIDPYFLGLWLGDGNSHQLKINSDRRDSKEIEGNIKKCGYRTERTSSETRCDHIFVEKQTPERCPKTGRIKPCNKGLVGEFKKLGLLSIAGSGKSNKYIPDEYKYSSIEQRLSIVQGLMDSDGSCRKSDGLCIFSNSNKNIAHGLAQILRSIGLVPRVKVIENPVCTNNGSIGSRAYRVEFTCTNEIRIFRLERKFKNQISKSKKPKQRSIVNVKRIKSVPVRCISVRSKGHLFLCGKSFIATHNTFAGGHLTLIGSNSPSNLAMRPIRILLADEICRYPASAGTEGNPVDLAEQRTTTFHNRLIFLVSTPTEKYLCQITDAYEKTSMGKYSMPCPSCDHYNFVTRSQIVVDSEPLRVRVACSECGSIHTEREWKSKEGAYIHEQPDNPDRGFWLNAYASNFITWEEIEKKHEKAKDSPEKMQVFTNTVLAEVWDEIGERANPMRLLDRRENYEEIPQDCLILTLAVDVQDNRLEYEICGWGDELESWSIEYGILLGDPADKKVWGQLKDIFNNKKFKHQSGAEMGIIAMVIDLGGHHTQTVYDFCESMKPERVWPIRGVGGWGLPLIKEGITKNKRTGKKVKLWNIAVDQAKIWLDRRLRQDEPGPGYCHFNFKFNDELYFEGLTAEKLVNSKDKRGFPTKKWVLEPGKRNEPLDLRVYNYACVKMLNPVWDKLKRAYTNGSVKPITKSASKRRRRGVLSKGIT